MGSNDKSANKCCLIKRRMQTEQLPGFHKVHSIYSRLATNMYPDQKFKQKQTKQTNEQNANKNIKYFLPLCKILHIPWLKRDHHATDEVLCCTGEG